MSAKGDCGSKDAGPLATLGAVVVLAAMMGATPSDGGSAQSADQPMCKGQVATIVAEPGVVTKGTTGADVIVGTDGADTINGRGGDDIICGLGGDDVLRGAAGLDQVFGGAGNDLLSGGPGDDLIQGGSGEDRCKTPAKENDHATSCEGHP